MSSNISDLRQVLMSETINFSRNIKKLASNKSKLGNHYRVLKLGWCNVSGKVEVDRGTLYFGYLDDVGHFVGGSVMSAACNNFKSSCIVSFGGRPASEMEFKDVTEWFVSEYKDKGMCTYSDSNHSWVDTVGGRFCSVCYKEQIEMRKMVEKVWFEDKK